MNSTCSLNGSLFLSKRVHLFDFLYHYFASSHVSQQVFSCFFLSLSLFFRCLSLLIAKTIPLRQIAGEKEETDMHMYTGCVFTNDDQTI